MFKIALTLAAVACLAIPAHAQDVIKPVKLLTVTPANDTAVRQFFGKVVARQTVDLAFQVGGQIIDLPAVEGEVTPKGQMIAQLDLEPFELALEQARLQKEQADRAVERYTQLQGSTVSQVTLEDAVTAAALSDVALRLAENDLEHATMLAPFDALVAQRIIQNFTTISPGTAIVRLHDMSELRIEIDVPEVLFQRAGNDPDVVVTAIFPATDQVFPLEIREFNAEASNVGQTFKLTFGMAPPENTRILPGSSVTVTVRLKGTTPSLLVPPTAVVPDAIGGFAALVFDTDNGNTGVLRRVAIDAQPQTSGMLQIISGLEPGDQIVAMGASALEDGQQVRRFTAFGQ